MFISANQFTFAEPREDATANISYHRLYQVMIYACQGGRIPGQYSLHDLHIVSFAEPRQDATFFTRRTNQIPI